MVQKTFSMDRDISSYVMVFEECIPSDICKQTCDEIENASWQQHTFYDPIDGSSITRSGSRELDVSYNRGVSTHPCIKQTIHEAFKEYLTRLQMPWFHGWSGFSEVRFNRYEENRLMAEHCDHIHSLFDGERKGIPTMTFLAALNDEYTGGELVMWGDEVVPMAKGSAVVFPSCFLYPHRVDPITSGIRYSCVSWSW